MFSIAILFGVATNAITSVSDAPILHNCTFEEAYAFNHVQCAALISNPSDSLLRLTLTPTWEGDSVERNVTIPAHGKTVVPLHVSLGNHAGELTRYFEVQRADGREMKVYLEATGFVMTALDDPRPVVDFGSIAMNLPEPMEKTLTLGSHDTPSFRLERILEKPAQVDAQIASDHRTLRVRVRQDAPWGVLNGTIKLAIDTPRQKQAWVGVRGTLHGDVAPQANPVSLGILEAHREQLLQLTEIRKTNGGTFSTGPLRVEGIQGEAEIAECTPRVDSCKVVRLKVSESQPAGMVRGKVFIALPDDHRDLAIDIEGFFQAEQTATAADKPDADDVQPRIVKLPQLLAEESDEEAMPKPAVGAEAPPGTGPLLKWNVLDERVVYGYQIFRSDSQGGPFVLLNVPAIPAKSNSKSGSAYQWRDASAKKGETYWYYVGVVYEDGRKEKITPEIKAVAR